MEAKRSLIPIEYNGNTEAFGRLYAVYDIIIIYCSGR